MVVSDEVLARTIELQLVSIPPAAVGVAPSRGRPEQAGIQVGARVEAAKLVAEKSPDRQLDRCEH